MSDIENVEMTEIEVNKTKKKSENKKKKAEKDVWDYIIIETGIACGILLVILLVNFFGGIDLSTVESVIARFTFIGKNAVSLTALPYSFI